MKYGRLTIAIFVSAVLSPQVGFCEVDSKGDVCIENSCFAATETISGKVLPLKGVAQFRYLFFDVYAAALYVPKEVTRFEDLKDDVPVLLVLEYQRELSASDFIESSEKMLKKNPEVRLEEISNDVKKLYDAYAAVEPRDRYSLRYDPAVGISLELNGRTQAVFGGPDFRKALLGIWLSKFSVDKDFTRALFGLPV